MAVLIEGPKWCGKTTTALFQAIDYFYANENTNLYFMRTVKSRDC